MVSEDLLFLVGAHGGTVEVEDLPGGFVGFGLEDHGLDAVVLLWGGVVVVVEEGYLLGGDLQLGFLGGVADLFVAVSLLELLQEVWVMMGVLHDRLFSVTFLSLGCCGFS